MTEIKYPTGRVVHGLPERLVLVGTDLVRNRDSVHRRWCYHVRDREVTAWDWPAGKSRQEVESASLNGLRFCASCRPIEHLPEEEQG